LLISELGEVGAVAHSLLAGELHDEVHGLGKVVVVLGREGLGTRPW